MKRLFLPLLALTFLGVLSAMSFPGSHPPSSKPNHHPVAKKARDISYYFYDTNDNYVDYNTADQEEFNLEEEYGVYVDDNPIGGTLLERGYTIGGLPHMTFASIMLYGHFGN